MDKEKFLDWLISYVEDLDLEEKISLDYSPHQFYCLGCYEFIHLLTSLISKGIFDLLEEEK